MLLRSWWGKLLPSAPGRNTIRTSIMEDVRPVSDQDSYVAAQMQIAIAALEPFEAHKECPKCKSTALTTEYGKKFCEVCTWRTR